MNISMFFLIAALILAGSPAWAALPMITDDTGTQGTGKFQLEVGGEYDREREVREGETVRELDYGVTPTLSYGMGDSLDVFVALPYGITSQTATDSGAGRQVLGGMGDLYAGLLWRFYEQEGLSFGIKPAVSFPTGNEDKDTGTGRVDYRAFLIMTKKVDPWTWNVNFGYGYNPNRLDERNNLWHVSAAALYGATKNLKIGLDAGLDTDRDATAEVEPGYVTGALIYSAGKDLDLSFGIKKALKDSSTDWAVLPGMTYRF